jgi:hypothetical protein
MHDFQSHVLFGCRRWKRFRLSAVIKMSWRAFLKVNQARLYKLRLASPLSQATQTEL